MSTPETLEQRVYREIASSQPVRFYLLDARLRSWLPGQNGFRRLDRTLQKLRRAGLIRYDSKGGWMLRDA